MKNGTTERWKENVTCDARRHDFAVHLATVKHVDLTVTAAADNHAAIDLSAPHPLHTHTDRQIDRVREQAYNSNQQIQRAQIV